MASVQLADYAACMPRLPRFFAPGLPLHVIQRGNNRSATFRHGDDHAFYIACLAHAARRHGVAIHAYVLMTNHVHLLVTPSCSSSLPKMMQAIGRVYVRHFNSLHERTGTLWEGRYKAAIVDDETYVLTCMRYIELNPVRAGLVCAPDEYRWSSYRANVWGALDGLIDPHDSYRQLGRSPAERRSAYRELFRESIPDATLRDIRDATQHAWALGSTMFRRCVTASGRRAERLPLGRPKKHAAESRKVDSDPTS
jgi:putative transposase